MSNVCLLEAAPLATASTLINRVTSILAIAISLTDEELYMLRYSALKALAFLPFISKVRNSPGFENAAHKAVLMWLMQL